MVERHRRRGFGAVHEEAGCHGGEEEGRGVRHDERSEGKSTCQYCCPFTGETSRHRECRCECHGGDQNRCDCFSHGRVHFFGPFSAPITGAVVYLQRMESIQSTSCSG
ncbi:hypothetical protein SEVIR_2G349350v4 [Setaria viridis]